MIVCFIYKTFDLLYISRPYKVPTVDHTNMNKSISNDQNTLHINCKMFKTNYANCDGSIL
jgi:hypothetical protein